MPGLNCITFFDNESIKASAEPLWIRPLLMGCEKTLFSAIPET